MSREGEIIKDNATPAKKEWEEYARKAKSTIKGYQIIKSFSGPGRIEDSREAEYMIVYRPHGVCYHHSYGLVSKFFKGLIDKELFGTKCPLCGTVYCPPRLHCWNPKCRVTQTEWVSLPLRGKVHTFSVMLFSADAFLEMLPFVLGYIQIEGAHTALPIQIVASPTGIFIGQEVEIRYRKERTGDLMDIYCVPLKEQAIPGDSCLHKYSRNLDDLNRDLENTNKFLEKRFGINRDNISKRGLET